MSRDYTTKRQYSRHFPVITGGTTRKEDTVQKHVNQMLGVNQQASRVRTRASGSMDRSLTPRREQEKYQGGHHGNQGGYLDIRDSVTSKQEESPRKHLERFQYHKDTEQDQDSGRNPETMKGPDRKDRKSWEHKYGLGGDSALEGYRSRVYVQAPHTVLDDYGCPFDPLDIQELYTYPSHDDYGRPLDPQQAADKAMRLLNLQEEAERKFLERMQQDQQDQHLKRNPETMKDPDQKNGRVGTEKYPRKGKTDEKRDSHEVSEGAQDCLYSNSSVENSAEGQNKKSKNTFQDTAVGSVNTSEIRHQENNAQSKNQETETVNPDEGEQKKRMIRRYFKEIERGNHTVYLARYKTAYEDAENQIKRVEIGPKNTTGVDEKVIMLLGATGSGKTTLINAMFNHMYGVEANNNLRFKLIDELFHKNQAHSQTTWITVYTVHHQPWFTMPYTLTIIDTPGFGSTEGTAGDKEITEQIRTFFKIQGIHGIERLDAVGFVMQASLPRLTTSQRYIIDSVLNLFGRDMKDNIFMLLTFADGVNPPVLGAIREAAIPYRRYFLFNNGSRYQKSSIMSEIFWKMGAESFDQFISEVGKLEPQSLTMTQLILQERCKLERAVQNVQKSMRSSKNTLKELKTEREALKQHQTDIDRNKDFTYNTVEQKKEKVRTKPGVTAINCKVCDVTCFLEVLKGCNSVEDFLKEFIGVSCPTCPNQCSSTKHLAQGYFFVAKTRKVRRNSDYLCEKYGQEQKKKLNFKHAVDQCDRRSSQMQRDTLRFLDQVQGHHKVLREKALNHVTSSIEKDIERLLEAQPTSLDVNFVHELRRLQRKIAASSHDTSGIDAEGYDSLEEEDEAEHFPFSNRQKTARLVSHEHLLQLSKSICDETTRISLGLYLGLRPKEVEMARVDNPNDFTQATYQMLGKWFANLEDKTEAFDELAEALKKCEQSSLITEVLEA